MLDQVKNYYDDYDEDGRLFRDKAHLPEYLTTIRYFDRLFTAGSRILDVCAGTGRYSFYLANKGHIVTACDLSEHNIDIIRSKSDVNKLADTAVCNVLNLARFEENSFDVVLCMGAMYHLPLDIVKTQAIQECIRVCNLGGLVVLSYLNYFAMVAAELQDGLANLDQLVMTIDNEDDFLFTPATPAKIEKCAKDAGLDILHNIGVDGLSFVLKDKVNMASDEIFDKWMEYIYKYCEEPSIIGCSQHGLLIGRKTL
ncbi:MAG: methyltransferase domain-containing protein [Clostridiales bacterium]|jgi:2-polyprenyl-3-methyl-5-hydroxy-6-metoxy-1,4-benzoquinol methylase|nr:methyltransferase domain-containing protein [Clostridiales bacterium]